MSPWSVACSMLVRQSHHPGFSGVLPQWAPPAHPPAQALPRAELLDKHFPCALRCLLRVCAPTTMLC